MEHASAREFYSLTDFGGTYGHGRLQASACRIRADNRSHLLSPARPPLAASVLCMAAVRSLPEVPRVASISRILARQARRSPAFGYRCALQTDQTSRNQRP